MWFLKVDLADAFGTIIYPEILEVLAKRIGAAGTLAMMNITCGHPLVPYRLGVVGEAVPVRKGCRQGAPTNPQLWNVLLGEVWPRSSRSVSRRGVTISCLLWLPQIGGRLPRTWVEAAPWCNHFGDVDDLVFVATSPTDVQHLYSDLGKRLAVAEDS